MIAIWVKVRVRPEGLERFLAGIETDALGSERDEPGCVRFNVLQDAEDELTYYFYEVYEDEAALDGAPRGAALRRLGGGLGHARGRDRDQESINRLPLGRGILEVNQGRRVTHEEP